MTPASSDDGKNRDDAGVKTIPASVGSGRNSVLWQYPRHRLGSADSGRSENEDRAAGIAP